MVGLDSRSGGGIHWVAYWVDGSTADHIDSYGLHSPGELATVLNCPIRLKHSSCRGPIIWNAATFAYLCSESLVLVKILKTLLLNPYKLVEFRVFSVSKNAC